MTMTGSTASVRKKPNAGQVLVEQQGKREAQHQLDRDGAGDEHRTAVDGVQEPVVAEQGDVVGEPGPGGAQLLAEGPLGEADVERVEERVDENGQQQERRRADEQQRGASSTARRACAARGSQLTFRSWPFARQVSWPLEARGGMALLSAP